MGVFDIKTIIQNIKFSFINMWKWSKSYIFLSLIFALMPPIFSLITLYANRFFINSLFVKNKYLFLFFIIYFFVDFIVVIFLGLLNKKFFVLQNTIQMKYQYILYAKNMEIDYENVENSEMNNDFVIAFNDTITNNCAPVNIINTIFSLIAAFIGFVLYGAIISSISIYLLIVILLIGVLSYVFNLSNQKYFEKNKEEITLLDRKLGYIYSTSENYEFAKDIRIYNYKRLFFPIYDSIKKLRILWEKKLSFNRLCFNLIMSILLFLQSALTYFFAYRMLKNNMLFPGDFVYYITSIGTFSSWIADIFSCISNIHIQSIKTSHFKKYFDIKNKFKYIGGINIPVKKNYKLEFKNVCYRYNGAEKDAIHNISFVLNTGNKTAFVGLNGAGKTTIIKLLCGLYAPTSGEILLDDIPIQEYNIFDYYSLFSPVFQDMHLLPVTIEEFIKSDFKYETTNDDTEVKINKAIDISGLRNKIDSLPNGIKTRLMKGIFPDSIDLSGGEKQSLMIARAIYKDSPFIVLDEPASALDPIAENNLYKTCESIFKDKCIIFVSHRMSSVSFCDSIMLIDDNVIKEYGSHDVLIQNNGLYKQMYMTQSQYYCNGGDNNG